MEVVVDYGFILIKISFFTVSVSDTLFVFF